MAGRKGRFTDEVLVKALVAGSAGGKTTEDVAKELGVTVTYLSPRFSALRAKYAKMGKQLPYLAKKDSGSVAISDEFQAILDALPNVESATDA